MPKGRKREMKAKSKIKFIFDVDGTLTPSRMPIDKDFGVWFESFAKSHDVYLVTGSDRPKTLEQIGENIYNSCKRVYNCNGNDVWEKDVNVRSNDWVLPEDAHEWLSIQLTESDFKIRTGLHFEHRPGMVNFSVVGRNANKEQRSEYVTYDTLTSERATIARQFNTLFPSIRATVGGETGIDISPLFTDKAQIIKDFDPEDTKYFFGDRMDKEGNDYPLAQVVNHSRAVRDWKQTKEYLEHLLEAGLE
jgi:phosphomannomutase